MAALSSRPRSNPGAAPPGFSLHDGHPMPRQRIALLVVTTLGLLVGNALAAAQPAQAGSAPAAQARLVDINSASRKDLKTLPGIGDAEADRIIACRPFLTKADLVTKKVLPAGPFLTLKDRVVAVQKSRPKASRAASGGGCG